MEELTLKFQFIKNYKSWKVGDYIDLIEYKRFNEEGRKSCVEVKPKQEEKIQKYFKKNLEVTNEVRNFVE